jgi:hypothetical protein
MQTSSRNTIRLNTSGAAQKVVSCKIITSNIPRHKCLNNYKEESKAHIFK